MGRTAQNFSPSASYAQGDLCLYNGYLFEFKTSHSGAWDADDVDPYDSTMEQDITRIISGCNNAIMATAFANSLVMQPVLIEGNRYRFILSNAQN